MKPIDFDSYFQDMVRQWVEENEARFEDPDDMESEIPTIYETFVNTEVDWLEGKSPVSYFAEFNDSKLLLDSITNYIDAEISVPDLLLERLVELGDEDAIISIVEDPKISTETRMYAIDILRQLDSRKPLVTYLRWIALQQEDEDLRENALDSIRLMGEEIYGSAKIAFQAGNESVKEALLDVLCDYPEKKDEDVFSFAHSQFKKTQDKRALYAAYLAKLDNDHALEALLDVAESDDVSYIDFIEIRSAIERLGSEAPIRDFSKDPTYIAVQELQKGDDDE